jgi:hypothetical protein
MQFREGGGFKYTSLPQELLDMSEELNNLGGGDVRVAKLTTFCRIRPQLTDSSTSRSKKNCESIVTSTEGNYVHVR